jgi:hypothetical protein
MVGVCDIIIYFTFGKLGQDIYKKKIEYHL